eukprot:m.151297 g.151297  ORF g.151297 m.151297 type:complete len:66 (-) comp14248_c0_seq1:198-395(-)
MTRFITLVWGFEESELPAVIAHYTQGSTHFLPKTDLGRMDTTTADIKEFLTAIENGEVHSCLLHT